MPNLDAFLLGAWLGNSASCIICELTPDLAKFRLVSVLVVVVVVVYLTGMALKTGVLETQLPDIVET